MKYFKELSKEELMSINGGEISPWWKLAGYLISPLFGQINAGFIDGYNDTHP